MDGSMIQGKRLRENIIPLARKVHGIAHRYRLAILYLLSHDPKETWEITEELAIKESLAVHHLQYMVQTGWIKRVRVGRHVTYELEESVVGELKKFLGNTPFFQRIFSKPR